MKNIYFFQGNTLSADENFCVSMGKTIWELQNLSKNRFFQGKCQKCGSPAGTEYFIPQE
jgi:hypothetical protein